MIDRELIEKVKKGDKKAFEELFMLEYVKVFSRIKSNMISFSESDVEDVTQDVFIKVYEKINTLENPDAFEAWLMRIARNSAINEIEKRKKVVLFSKISDEEDITQEDLLENEYNAFKPEEYLTRKELEENVNEILKNLPPHLSICWQMKQYEDMSYQEIADELGISLSTVKNNIFQCKKRIKTEMEKRKLYAKAPVLYFLWLYKQYVEGMEIPSKEIQKIWKSIQYTISGQAVSTNGIAESVGEDAAKSASKKVPGQMILDATGSTAGKTAFLGGLSLGKTIAIVSIVAILALGGALGLYFQSNIQSQQVEDYKENEESEDLSSDSEDINNKDNIENVNQNSADLMQNDMQNTKIVQPTEEDFAKLYEETLLLQLLINSSDLKKLSAEDQMYLLIPYATIYADREEDLDIKKNVPDMTEEAEYANAISVEDFVSIISNKLEISALTVEQINNTEWSGMKENTWNIQFNVKNGFIYYNIPPFGWGEGYDYDTYTILQEIGEELYIKCDYNYYTDLPVEDGHQNGVYAFSYYLKGCVKEKNEKRFWDFSEWKYDDSQAVKNTEIHIENVHLQNEKQTEYPFCEDEYWATAPIVTYSVNGIEESLEVEEEKNNIFPISELGTEYAYDVIKQVKDVTNDGIDELILHFIYAGNNVCESLGSTYIYTVDQESGQLKKILSINSDAAEQYKSGFSLNAGVYAHDGWLELNVMSYKMEEYELKMDVVKLIYEDGIWNAYESDGESYYYGNVNEFNNR